MFKTETKPRWKTWESLCIKQSVEEKIHLKLIALALGKTINAVSKKISHMGLKKIPSKPGPKKMSPALRATATSEMERMKAILSLYAPFGCVEKGQNALKKGALTTQQSLPLSPSRPSLKYNLAAEKIPPKKIREYKDERPVPFSYLKTWALSEGFQPVSGPLLKKGIFCWKDGRHFSKAQLVMYIALYPQTSEQNALQRLCL